MWQHNYEPIGGSLALSAPVAALPDRRAVRDAGRLAQAGLDVGAGRRWSPPLVVAARRLRHAGAAGGDLDDLRRGLRALPDRLDRLQLDHALPAGGRHRQVRDHQGLGRQPHRRPAAAGDVHRLLVRRVHRRRGRASARRWRCRARCSPASASIPFYAAGICLLANTAPVAFGSIGIPVRRWPTSPACR